MCIKTLNSGSLVEIQDRSVQCRERKNRAMTGMNNVVASVLVERSPCDHHVGAYAEVYIFRCSAGHLDK